MSQHKYDYIVVGAGLCGLAVAHFIKKKGINNFRIISGKSQTKNRKIKLSGGLFDDLSNVVSYGFGGNRDIWGGRVTFDPRAREMSCIHQDCVDFVNTEVFKCDVKTLSADYDEIWLDNASLKHLNYLKAHSVDAYVDAIGSDGNTNYVQLNDRRRLLAKKIIICAGAFETARLVATMLDMKKLPYFGHISAVCDTLEKFERPLYQFHYCHNALAKNYIYENTDTNAVYSIVNKDFSENNTFLTALISILMKLKVISLFLRNPILEKSLTKRFDWKRVFKGLLSVGIGDFVDAFHLIYQKLVRSRRLPIRLLRNPNNSYRVHVQIPSLNYTSSVVELDNDDKLCVNWDWKEEGLIALSRSIASDLSAIGLGELKIDELKSALAKSKDGYHSFDLLQIDYSGMDANRTIRSDLTVKGFPNISVGSTALISSESLHFPTLMGTLLSVQAIMNLERSS